jgi:amino acid transporter
MSADAPTAAPAAGAPAVESLQLHRRTLGVPHVVFFIVAASAPLTVVAGGQSVSYLVTGNEAIPFMFIPLGIVLALFVTGYALMSQYITNTGAFYAYVSKGIGKVAAVGTAFLALFSYNAMQIGIYGLFGVAMGAFAADNLSLEWQWYTWCFIALGIIAVLGLLQVDLNATVLAFFLVAEILVVAIFDFAILGDPGPDGLTLTGFDPDKTFGLNAGAVLTFAMAAYVGFESAAIYSEECRDPRRTVARATYIAVAFITILYALSAWLLGVAAGPEVITNPEALVEAGFTTPDGAAPDPTTVLFATGADRIGEFWGDAASLLFATSLFAALLSFHNGVARYFFAIGRERVIPRFFGRVSDRTGAPVVGSLTQTLLALAVLLVFAIGDLDPVLKLFTWLTNIGAIGVMALLALASFAVAGFFRRNPELEASPWKTRWAPLIAGVALAAIFVIALLNLNVSITGVTDAPLDDLTIILPALLFGFGIAGCVVGLVLRARRPDVYAVIGEGAEAEEVLAREEAQETQSRR